MIVRPRLEPWADLGRLDPQGLAMLLGPPSPQDGLQRLIELSTRLPRGLIHAEAVHVLAESPPDREPLAASSAWYALGREIAVVIDPAEADSLDDLLYDVAAYAALSRRLADAAGDDPELAEAAGRTDTADPAVLRLIGHLESAAHRWYTLDERAPGLRDDVRAMLHRPFDAPIHIHPHVRPRWLEDAGRAWADELWARCPSERPWIVISDGPEPIELMSPYARDLTAALGQWAHENPGEIRQAGLLDAWEEAPEDELASMVVPDLLRHAPALLSERRTNERTQGMFIDDRLGAQAGYVEVGRLAAPDAHAVPAGAHATALVVAGGAVNLRVAMAEHWVARGLSGLAAVLSVDVAGSLPIIPKVVADAADAYVLPGTAELVAEAAALGIEVVADDVLAITGQRRTSTVRTLGQVRRGQLCGDIDAHTPVYVAFLPGKSVLSTPPLPQRRAAFDAARLVLRRAWLPVSDRGPGSPKTPRNPGKDAVQRRFRA